MKTLTGYLRTMRQYLATPKGRHDSRDYARAVLLIVLSMLLVWLVLLIGLKGGI
ncbi:MAG: hypothetical protein KBI24_08220 [Selenomonas sp.]|nr:hypothetical protein [Selenomonas sp.]